MAPTDQKILLIDSYDSFALNLAALFHRVTGCEIFIVQHDQFSISELETLLPAFEAIIVGPGPGTPSSSLIDLWLRTRDIPIIGVCLGHQSLGMAFGGCLERLRVVKHGLLSFLIHNGEDLFEGVGRAEVVRYHSLHIVLGSNNHLKPLAYSEDENGLTIMAMRHRKLPFWGVQFHPESISSRIGGLESVQNFWKMAQEWNSCRRGPIHFSEEARRAFKTIWPPLLTSSKDLQLEGQGSPVASLRLLLPVISIPEVAEAFGASGSEPFVILDSASLPGRFSIIACTLPSSLQIQYYIGEDCVLIKQGLLTSRQPLGSQSIWQWCSSFMNQRTRNRGNSDTPFWGGLIGSLSYELGVETLYISKASTSRRHPDLNLIYVERSVVVDHYTNIVHVQSLLSDDNAWLSSARGILANLSNKSQSHAYSATNGGYSHNRDTSNPIIEKPNKTKYISKIYDAQEHLLAGNSYELCLTAQTSVKHSHSSISSWQRYKRLREVNPAPHSSYIRLYPSTSLSSSPERFLFVSRSPNAICQLRPIKGTLRKTPSVTRPIAETLLKGSKKEVAENRMIADLIRHDLHGALGDSVDVKKFCEVEEYESVWQLVSVIEGRVAGCQSRHAGWEVLRRCLPPGSMTGAPKKRSVEILQELEDSPRGPYSGLIGYWCVSGQQDWSVTIRTATHLDEPSGTKGKDTDHPEEWLIGAGGAITALSDAEAEWDEMTLKLQSVLRSFAS